MENTKIFSENEIKYVRDNQDVELMDSILFMLYSGLRVGEVFTLKSDNVNLDKGYIYVHVKGRNRIVPIHSKISDIVKARLADDGEYLFQYNSEPIYKDVFYRFWKNVKGSIGNQSLHDCRHTFHTRLTNAGADENCINYIMGYRQSNGTLDNIDLDKLKEAVEMID